MKLFEGVRQRGMKKMSRNRRLGSHPTRSNIQLTASPTALLRARARAARAMRGRFITTIIMNTQNSFWSKHRDKMTGCGAGAPVAVRSSAAWSVARRVQPSVLSLAVAVSALYTYKIRKKSPRRY